MVAMVEDVRLVESGVASAALAERLFQSTLATWDIATVYLGHHLGIYRALAAIEPATSRELGAEAGLAERYVREWLSAMCASG